MPSKVYSAAVVGVETFEVEIKVDAGWGKSRQDRGCRAAGHRLAHCLRKGVSQQFLTTDKWSFGRWVEFP